MKVSFGKNCQPLGTPSKVKAVNCQPILKKNDQVNQTDVFVNSRKPKQENVTFGGKLKNLFNKLQKS